MMAEFLGKRVKGYSIIFLTAYVVYFIYGLFMIKDSMMGIDFSAFYSAGKMTLEGNSYLVYDILEHHNVLEGVLGMEIPFLLAWFYPPIFLLLVTPLVLLPFKLAMVFWLTSTFIIYMIAVKKISLSPKGMYAAMCFPGVLMNLNWGQNGFLTVGLFGLGIYNLEKRPLVSGMMFALLCFKPHFAIVAFIVLLFSKLWKVFFSAVFFLLVLVILSSGIFGLDTWIVYIKAQLNTPSIILESIWKSTAAIQPSVYSSLKVIGMPGKLALIFQLMMTTCMFLITLWTWRNINSLSMRGTILVLGTLLCTPYYAQYDLILLILPFIWYLNDCKLHGWLKWDFVIIVMLWLTPLINLPIVHLTHIQIAPFTLIIATILTCRRLYVFHYKNFSGDSENENDLVINSP
ncbi:MAG: DUF2029 domain-containing protein [Clostridiales bacterium]|nr:DUF2029 domain-containing protein [Clostridiales bacterium]